MNGTSRRVGLAEFGLDEVWWPRERSSWRVRLVSVHKQYLCLTGNVKDFDGGLLEIGVTNEEGRAEVFEWRKEEEGTVSLKATSLWKDKDGRTWWLDVVEENDVGIVGRLGEEPVAVTMKMDGMGRSRVGLTGKEASSGKFVSARWFGRLVMEPRAQAWESWGVEVETLDGHWENVDVVVARAVLGHCREVDVFLYGKKGEVIGLVEDGKVQRLARGGKGVSIRMEKVGGQEEALGWTLSVAENGKALGWDEKGIFVGEEPGLMSVSVNSDGRLVFSIQNTLGRVLLWDNLEWCEDREGWKPVGFAFDVEWDDAKGTLSTESKECKAIENERSSYTGEPPSSPITDGSSPMSAVPPDAPRDFPAIDVSIESCHLADEEAAAKPTESDASLKDSHEQSREESILSETKDKEEAMDVVETKGTSDQERLDLCIDKPGRETAGLEPRLEVLEVSIISEPTEKSEGEAGVEDFTRESSPETSHPSEAREACPRSTDQGDGEAPARESDPGGSAIACISPSDLKSEGDAAIEHFSRDSSPETSNPSELCEFCPRNTDRDEGGAPANESDPGESAISCISPSDTAPALTKNQIKNRKKRLRKKLSKNAVAS